MMGTTVTPNLALIKPDTSESIKANLPTFAGWAVQNAANCDIIDGLFRVSTHSYTPTWTADVTPPTLGSGGSVEGKFVRVMPRMVALYFRIIMGTTGFNPGSGFYTISLPAAAPVASEFASFASDGTGMGKATYFDASAVASCNVFVTMYGLSGNSIFLKKNDGDAWRSTTPVVPAQGDIVSGYAMYPTGAA